MKKLVIVESPSKSHTIEKYLGKDYKVVSSKGHIRDLATSGKYGLGVDIEDNFKPNYVPIKGKKKDITALKKEVKASDFVYLATDPDREGEAISWHLYDCLDLNDDNYDRIVFNEITKKAILESFNHARKIDQNLVNSQETRRILDRIIGFRLSKLMQKKTSGSSAGRVQSVALKLVVDKEREIEQFKEEEYWTITANFNDFDADLFNYKNKKIELKNEVEADKVLSALSTSFKIDSVEKKNTTKSSKFAFTTSTLQQAASSLLNMAPKKTMSLAQKLYEGIALEDETVGLISYMRTDSTRLSAEFIDDTFKYIEGKYGKEYRGIVKKSKKTDNIQDAHEAIRPTSIKRDPLSVKKYLTDDEYKLYRLIYYRTLAYLMAPAGLANTTVILDNNDYKFKATGQVITFDGYLKVYSEYEKTKENVLPPFDSFKSNIIVSNDIIKEQHFTKPPARYTESSLIKDLEELGIGRPSTYVTIMSNIKDRGYVVLKEKKFYPTDIGIEVTDKLQECFSHIINVEYTANMENDLDNIADGKVEGVKILSSFYKEFDSALEEAFEKLEKKEPTKVGEDCPNCGHPLVIRRGRYGEFVACSNFPECKYIKAEENKITEICDCPNCDGKIVEKKTKKGKLFYGCNNYPKCKTAYWDLPIGEKCPSCGGMLTKKKDTIKCSSCDYSK